MQIPFPIRAGRALRGGLVRAALPVVLLTTLSTLSTPPPLRAQGLGPGAAGAGVGLGVGLVTTVGSLAARSAFGGEPIWAPDELTGWPLALVGAGAASGIWLGTTDADRLTDASVAALAAGAAGSALGMLTARVLMGPDDDAAPWAGALMGAGLGTLLGWVLGATLAGGSP